MKVYRAVDGVLTPVATAATTHDQVTAQTGHGVYATFRTYHGHQAFRIEAQLTRMQTSAQVLGIALPHSVDGLRAVVRQAVHAAGYPESRIRITALHDSPDVLIASVEPFSPPSEQIRRQGVHVGLARHQREAARAKDSRWTDDRTTFAQAATYEVMLHTAEGAILEGLSSNFYAVVDGTLKTADTGVLAGIARSVVLDVAPRLLPVTLKAPRLDEVFEAAFLTSSSRGVIPIHQMGDRPIPLGGVVFRLQAAYDDRIASELEAI